MLNSKLFPRDERDRVEIGSIRAWLKNGEINRGRKRRD